VTRLRGGQSSYHGSIPGRGDRFFSFPKYSDLFWSTQNLFLSGYKNLIFDGNDGVGMELTTNLHLPLLRMSGATLTPPIRLYEANKETSHLQFSFIAISNFLSHKMNHNNDQCFQ